VGKYKVGDTVVMDGGVVTRTILEVKGTQIKFQKCGAWHNEDSFNPKIVDEADTLRKQQLQTYGYDPYFTLPQGYILDGYDWDHSTPLKPFETQGEYEKRKRRESADFDYEKASENFTEGSHKELTEKDKETIVNNIYGIKDEDAE